MTADQRRSQGIDDMRRFLMMLERRITREEHRYVGPSTNVATVAAAKMADLPADPRPGDLGVAADTGQVYTADAAGVWQPGGTLP